MIFLLCASALAQSPSRKQGRTGEPWPEDQGSRFERARLDALPGPRNIWSLLKNQDISSVTNHLDEGGFQTGILILVGVHGGTWTQNSYHWDGLDITDPYESGRPLSYPDYSSIREFRVSASYHSAMIMSSGADFSLQSREGGRRLHGEAEAFYLGDALQSSNLDARLRGFGYQDTPHFLSFPQGEFALGGPLPRLKEASFFTSLGVQHVRRVIPDFTARPVTNIYSGLIRMDDTLRASDRLSMLISGQIVRNSDLGARSGITHSATLQGNDRFELVQGHWTHERNSQSSWNLSFGFSHASPTDTLHPEIAGPNYTRLFTGEMTGAPPAESDSALSRFSLSAHTNAVLGTSQNLQQRFDFGIDLEESIATEEKRVFEGLNLFLYPADLPSEVAEFNSPSHAKQRLREFSVFVEDRFRLGRAFVRLGVNLDSSHAFLPAQASGAGPYAPARTFAGRGGVVDWTTLSPRLGLTVPLWKRFGETRIVAGYSRYYHVLPAAYADFANPTALGGRLYRWNDTNHDGIFQPGEEGTLLRVFGGPYSSVDPSLGRPHTDEFGVGLEDDIGDLLRMSARLLQRDTRNLVQAVNTGVPFTAYAPASVLDPGNDGIPGTSDDQVLTLFNQDPGALGLDHYLLTNPAGLSSTYKGLEAELSGRLPARGFFSISFEAYKSVGDGSPGNSEFENDTGVTGSLFDNPNAVLNSRGRLFFDRAYVGKVAASYQAPAGLHLGAVISYFDGKPFGRRLIIPDFNQGPFFVMATPRGEPGGFRTQYNLNFDQRVSREFRLRSLRVMLMLDVFNLLNSNLNLSEYDLTGPHFAQRRPTEVQNPRAFRLGIKITF